MTVTTDEGGVGLSRADWHSRAVACELLAFSLRYPTFELAEAVMSGEWQEAACEVASALALDVPAGFAAESLAVDASGAPVASVGELFHVLRIEATRLFVGSPEPAVSPYEGLWRASDDGVKGLLFVNPHSIAVERFMSECGLGRPAGTNEPLDHIAVELEFLQFLASMAAGIVEVRSGGVAAADLPGGSPELAFAAFAGDHVQQWAPRFAESAASAARIPFYRAAARLLAALLASWLPQGRR